MASTNHLRKFSTTFYKNYSVNDARQIPSEDAVYIYKQGATVNGSFTVTTAGAGVSVTVKSCGRLKVDDTVQRDGAGTVMTVVEVTDDTHVKLRAASGTVALSPNQRLVLTGPQTAIAIYSDAEAVTPASSPYYLPATGLFEIYTPERQFDIMVGTTIYPDCEGGYVRGGGAWVNVKDFPSIQDAVDSLPSGVRGTVFIPAGFYPITTTIVTRATNTHFVGEAGFTYFTGTKDQIFIHLDHGACSVSNIDFYVASPGAGSGIGIKCRATGAGAAPANTANIFISNCSFDGMGSYGIDMTAVAPYAVYFNNIADCNFTNCSGGNVRVIDTTNDAGSYATTLWFDRCHFHSPPSGNYGTYGGAALTKGGVHLEQVTLCTFRSCYFEHFNCTTGLSLNGSVNNLAIIDCGWEYTTSSGDEQQYMITCSAVLFGSTISGNYIKRTPSTYDIRFFKDEATGGGAGNVEVQNLVICNNIFYTGKLTYDAADVDIVLANANDSVTLIANAKQDFGGTIRKIKITDNHSNQTFGQWRMNHIKLGRVNGIATIIDPVEGMIAFDYSVGAGQKLKVYMDGAWKYVNVT